MNNKGLRANIFNRFVLSAFAALTCLCAGAQGTAGDWNGELNVTPQMKLKIVFHISAPDADPAVIKIDSPDQGAFNIPAEVRYLSTDSVSFAIPSINMSFTGVVVEGMLKGTFKQGPLSLPLDLNPGENPRNRPQTPVPPFPYRTENFAIGNPEAKVKLAGTLTVPADATKSTPLVVMVTGSGQQNRDEELFGHKPFAVIADYLARNGVASFRYDDRGFGESTGNDKAITTADNASDAAAVMKFLRSIGRFGKTGILSHSEGGIVGFMLAARETDTPDFVVSIAGPAVRGDSIIVSQNRQALTVAGISADMIDEYIPALEKVLAYKISNPDKELTDEVIGEICRGWSDRPVFKDWAAGLKSSFGKPNAWLDSFIAYSPATDLLNAKAPMMILYGGKDTQVPAELNAPAARKLAPGAIVKVYPDLNHPMQHAVTGDISEYATIEETISTEVLSDILQFINSLK